jgi:hypothetical protein
MQENIITWNFANWVTITLMALVSFFLLGTLVSFLKSRGVGGDVAGNAAGQSAQA